MSAKEIKTYIQHIENKHIDFDDLIKKAVEFANEHGHGCYEVSIRKAVKPKSNDQLGAIFGLMIAGVVDQANDRGIDTSEFLKLLVRDDLPTGVALDKDFLKHLFYQVCPTYRGDKKITLSKASTIEAAKFFDNCRNLLASRGIYIPEPDKNWRDNLRAKR